MWRGFKFGMLLQLAVGPMCFLVFQTSAEHGFITGLWLVLAIALIDAIYITLSVLGLGAVMDNNKIKTVIRYFGAAVLIIFGIQMAAGAFGVQILPDIHLFQAQTGQNVFIQGLILTASNPLTIVFWSGVFSAQVVENHFRTKQLVFFGTGCVLSTLFFLSTVALIGTIFQSFLSPLVIQVMNICVGGIICFFGIRMMVQKEKTKSDSQCNVF